MQICALPIAHCPLGISLFLESRQSNLQRDTNNKTHVQTDDLDYRPFDQADLQSLVCYLTLCRYTQVHTRRILQQLMMIESYFYLTALLIAVGSLRSPEYTYIEKLPDKFWVIFCHPSMVEVKCSVKMAPANDVLRVYGTNELSEIGNYAYISATVSFC